MKRVKHARTAKRKTIKEKRTASSRVRYRTRGILDQDDPDVISDDGTLYPASKYQRGYET